MSAHDVMEVIVDSYVIVLTSNMATQGDVEDILAFAQERGFWDAALLPIEGEIVGVAQQSSVQRFLQGTGLDNRGHSGDRLRQLGIKAFRDFQQCNVRDVWAVLTEGSFADEGAKCFPRIIEEMRQRNATFADWNLTPKVGIDDLHLSTVAEHSLKGHGIEEVEVLRRLEDEDILKMRHMGATRVATIKEAVQEFIAEQS